MPTGVPGTRSIGWLDDSVEFPTGPVTESVARALRRFAEQPIRRMRGTHRCPFCPESSAARGTGELWLRGASGPIYVAPTLLPHYVEAHRYRPPDEFLAMFDRQVEPVPEAECERRIREQSARLASNPSRSEILVDYFDTRVVWHRSHFADLVEFERHVRELNVPGVHDLAAVLSLTEHGWAVQTGSHDPATLYAAIVRSHADPALAPYTYEFRLVFVEDEWRTQTPGSN